MSARHHMTDHVPGRNGRAIRNVTGAERIIAIAVMSLVMLASGVQL